MNLKTIGSLAYYLFPIVFIVVIWKKILHKAEINFIDLVITAYLVIWVIILTTIGFYIVMYYFYIKDTLGIKEEYMWAFLTLVIFLAVYNLYLRFKISRAKERQLDKW